MVLKLYRNFCCRITIQRIHSIFEAGCENNYFHRSSCSFLLRFLLARARATIKVVILPLNSAYCLVGVSVRFEAIVSLATDNASCEVLLLVIESLILKILENKTFFVIKSVEKTFVTINSEKKIFTDE